MQKRTRQIAQPNAKATNNAKFAKTNSPARCCRRKVATPGAAALFGLAALLAAGLTWGAAVPASAKPVAPARLAFPDVKVDVGLHGPKSRGGKGLIKLTPDLQALAAQFAGSRGAAHYSASQLTGRYGIAPGDRRPTVGVAVTVADGADTAPVTRNAGTAFFQIGRVVYGAMPVRALAALAADPQVVAVAPTKAASLPPKPGGAHPALGGLGRGADALPLAFDHRGLTGKGVVVGIVDSGIDWRHADFRHADGTTRILALWDMTDDSYAKSEGKIGSKPPAEKDDQPLGTLYTQAQIDAALKGTGKVVSGDTQGHGTACAGVAAANGLAPGGFAGVAPEADLVVVRAGQHEGISGLYYLGTRWIAQTAQGRHEPCVISESFGSQDSPHDGTSEEEAVMNDLAGPGKPGVILCAAAGNEGQKSLHAGGRFGPKQPGQADIQSDPIELFVTADTEMDGYFRHADAWGLAVLNLDGRVADKEGRPVPFALQPSDSGDDLDVLTPRSLTDHSGIRRCLQEAKMETLGGSQDKIALTLTPGHYMLFGIGAGAGVSDGTFDLYLPFAHDAAFGQGTDKRFMVGTPGTADGEIAVGSYIVRKAWTGRDGKRTAYNMVLGDIAPYSSPGFRRGGAVKPDLCAPGSYMISPMSPGSAMAEGDDHAPDPTHITPDGRHVVWDGTSAASPYVAGVIALLLQKNPALDEEQVRHILTGAAAHDDFTGAVPNPQWGYGKIDPAAALAATPEK